MEVLSWTRFPLSIVDSLHEADAHLFLEIADNKKY